MDGEGGIRGWKRLTNVSTCALEYKNNFKSRLKPISSYGFHSYAVAKAILIILHLCENIICCKKELGTTILYWQSLMTRLPTQKLLPDH